MASYEKATEMIGQARAAVYRMCRVPPSAIGVAVDPNGGWRIVARLPRAPRHKVEDFTIDDVRVVIEGSSPIYSH